MGFKRSTKVLIVSTILLDLFMCISLFVLYGPWPVFRNFWITTAMTTMNHKYLAHWFYSDETIAEVMSNNFVVETDEDTDTNLIEKNTDNQETTEYEDIYEEQILDRNPEDIYKVINISGSSYKGFLIAVYDPSKIKLAMTRYLGTRGDTLDVMAKNNNAVVAINGGGFIDPQGKGKGGIPTYTVIQNGKILNNSSSGSRRSGGIIGFDYNDNLILTKSNTQTAIDKYHIRDAVEFGPFLIVNGKPAFIKGNGGWGVAPRTAIGQRKDGIVLLLIIDGRQPGYSIGADMSQVTEIMMNYKAINAANLDGGASTGLIVEDNIMNKPAGVGGNGLRFLPNAWVVTK